MLSGSLDGKGVFERMDTDICMPESLCCPLKIITTLLINHIPIYGWMWELGYKESWVPKNWCFWTMVLEKTLESPLDFKEIQSVHLKENQSWIFIGRTDVDAENPILWPPDAKSWLIWEQPDAGKDWRWEEKGTTDDEMVGWHHLLNGHEFEWTLGVGDGQGGLACCSSWGLRVGHDWATELNLTELKVKLTSEIINTLYLLSNQLYSSSKCVLSISWRKSKQTTVS